MDAEAWSMAEGCCAYCYAEEAVFHCTGRAAGEQVEPCALAQHLTPSEAARHFEAFGHDCEIYCQEDDNS